MKEFSLVKNDGNIYPEFPPGFVLVFGNKRDDAIVFTDYDGKSDRQKPKDIEGEWFPLSIDFDSIMAWHGERRKEHSKDYGKIKWKKDRY